MGSLTVPTTIKESDHIRPTHLKGNCNGFQLDPKLPSTSKESFPRQALPARKLGGSSSTACPWTHLVIRVTMTTLPTKERLGSIASCIWETTRPNLRLEENHQSTRGICRIFFTLITRIRKMSTCTQLVLETLESQPIMPKKFPTYWC